MICSILAEGQRLYFIFWFVAAFAMIYVLADCTKLPTKTEWKREKIEQ